MPEERSTTKAIAPSELIETRLYPNEQEGFRRPLSVPEGEIPWCTTSPQGNPPHLTDFRGELPGKAVTITGRTFTEWETSPAQAKRETVFTWIGGSEVRPAMRPAYPMAQAVLTIDGKYTVEFPLGWPDRYTLHAGECTLEFQPQRAMTHVESYHRAFRIPNVSGFYRLTVPAGWVEEGQPLRLRVDLPALPDAQTVYFTSPRPDALATSLATLRGEVSMLQSDLTELRKAHEMLAAQIYTRLFPQRLQGERLIAAVDNILHLHPATVTALRDGEVIITCREGSDHLATDGHIVVTRSQDGGRTWSPRETLYDLGKSDHRCAPIFELPNGDWVTTDYRAGAFYDENGMFDWTRYDEYSLWGAWSTDRGKTWQFSTEPMTVPNEIKYGEVERHMILLPSGLLLVAVNYARFNASQAWDYTVDPVSVATFKSDDDGRSWQYLASIPDWKVGIEGECTLLRTKSGKILILARTQSLRTREGMGVGMLLQSVSHDDGNTWEPWHETAMSSMDSPGHLLQLQDGRILCTHASRCFPGSVYATVSRDEGETWDTANTRIITDDIPNFDSCYPNSAQLLDGTIITVWYANFFGKFHINVFRWRPEQILCPGSADL